MKVSTLLVAAIAGWSTVGAAQVHSDKARLDDFAMPPADVRVEVGQVSSTAPSVVVEQKIERSVAAAPASPSGVRSAGTEQLGDKADRGPVRQLGPVGERVTTASAPLSKREDGRPTGAERLAGSDRCDPQAGTVQMRAECRRILELRAAEFNATEAPRLSAEQELLARQTAKSGTSLATDFTIDRADKALFDADERNSQELGFVALNRPPPSPDSPPSDDPAGDAGLSDAIKSVLVQMGIPNP